MNRSDIIAVWERTRHAWRSGELSYYGTEIANIRKKDAEDDKLFATNKDHVGFINALVTLQPRSEEFLIFWDTDLTCILTSQRLMARKSTKVEHDVYELGDIKQFTGTSFLGWSGTMTILLRNGQTRKYTGLDSYMKSEFMSMAIARSQHATAIQKDADNDMRGQSYKNQHRNKAERDIEQFLERTQNAWASGGLSWLGDTYRKNAEKRHFFERIGCSADFVKMCNFLIPRTTEIMIVYGIYDLNCAMLTNQRLLLKLYSFRRNSDTYPKCTDSLRFFEKPDFLSCESFAEPRYIVYELVDILGYEYQDVRSSCPGLLTRETMIVLRDGTVHIHDSWGSYKNDICPQTIKSVIAASSKAHSEQKSADESAHRNEKGEQRSANGHKQDHSDAEGKSQNDDGDNTQRRANSEQSNRSTDSVTRDNNDAYYRDVLGATEEMSQIEIKKCYRSIIVKYHPDRVNGLGEEFKQLAERKTKEINEAYAYFCKKFDIAGD